MKNLLVLIAVVLLAVQFSVAQIKTPRVTKRQVNQQARIHEGVKSGELTKKEILRLEAQQAKIARDKAVAKSDGIVTPEERAKLQREQNRASHRIYRQKHDAQKRK